MARRSDHTRDELKELAVTAGWERLRDHGFKHFSARQVASDIGYTIGTLYNIFGSHDGLLLHINGRTLDHWFTAMQKAFAKNRKPPSLQALAHFYIDYSKANSATWLALFEHSLDEGTALPAWYGEKMQRFFATLEGVVIAQTGIGAKKARRDAHTLWAGIHGICVLSLTNKLVLVGAETPYTLADNLIEHYLRSQKR